MQVIAASLSMPVILSTLPIFRSEFAKEFATASFLSDRIAMSMDSFVDMRSTCYSRNTAGGIRETLSLDVLVPPPGLGHTNLSLQWLGSPAKVLRSLARARGHWSRRLAFQQGREAAENAARRTHDDVDIDNVPGIKNETKIVQRCQYFNMDELELDVEPEPCNDHHEAPEPAGQTIDEEGNGQIE